MFDLVASYAVEKVHCFRLFELVDHETLKSSHHKTEKLIETIKNSLETVIMFVGLRCQFVV